MSQKDYARKAAEMRILASKHSGKFADECRAQAIRFEKLIKLSNLGRVVSK